MTFKALFNTTQGLRALEKGKAFTRSDGRVPVNPKLHKIFNIIAANADEFDRNTQINVEFIGEDTIHRIGELGPTTETEDVEMLTALIYRFVAEYDMSIKNDVSRDVESFMSQVRREFVQYHDEARLQVEFARQEMAAFVVKRIVNSDEFGSLRNVSHIASQVEVKIKGWQHALNETEKQAVRLGEVLREHTQSFNFVGLHKGFSDLADGIKEELRVAQIAMGVFGVAVLLPAAIELFLISSGRIDLSHLSISTLIVISLTTVAMTLLLLYFFRIALRKADACRAQLIQIRLRMSLCRFIQSYADYSSEFKSKNEGALAKFESLIFSGIVSTDEKLPATFDGIEQLASLAKSITGKSQG